jgi:hypothetical protein
MKKLAREIIFVIVYEYGKEEFLKRISDPFWFQSFGCVLGFDWHSSGLTTTVCGAIKEGLKGTEREIGIFVCGGKGAISRNTPIEISNFSEKFSLSGGENLIYASKMSAKIDNVAVQDGYQLYHHTFIFTKEEKWAVIQQGMNENTRYARRYHWLSEEVKNFVVEPHKAICCDLKQTTLNMTAKESEETRKFSVFLSKEKPEKVIKEFQKIKELNLPSHHPVYLEDIKKENLQKILIKTYETQPENFENLISIYGVGPKTIRALALISELIYGTKLSWEDPVKYSFAHGGKDGHPYRINKKEYDRSIEILKEAILKAKIGDREKLEAIKRLTK